MGTWDPKRKRSHRSISWVVAPEPRPGQPCSRAIPAALPGPVLVGRAAHTDPCSVQGRSQGLVCPHMDTAESLFCFKPAPEAQACHLASWNRGN